MQNKFIYVFNEESFERLLLMGYSPLKIDKEHNVYVFENQEKLMFAMTEIECVHSDTLTF